VPIADVSKAILADGTPEGPNLSVASRVAHYYLLDEMSSCSNIFEMAK